MKKIKRFLQNWGIHSFLLPLFFILYNYNQYYGLISLTVAVKTFIQILIFTILFFLVLLMIIRNINKCLQITTLAGAVILFFGVIKDFFQFTLHLQFISRYSVLLPLILIITVFLIRLIARKNDYKKNNLFQNALLILFIFIEGVNLSDSDATFLSKNLLTKNTYTRPDSLSTPALKPDVYYLVFDSYPGTLFLQEYMNYDNSLFNAALEKRGFHVIKDPKSNYNRTIFSIASTLNYEYLKNIYSYTRISPKYYNHAKLTIKYSIVPKIFKDYNYTFYNLSIFDINDSPPIRRETFLVLPEKNVLMYNTLPERLRNDLFWHLLKGKNAVPAIQKFFSRKETELAADEKTKLNFNNTVIDSLLKIPLQNKGNHKFVYAHLYLPHPPFFYDENGKKNDFNYIITEESQRNKKLFLSYLNYTNKIILEITDKIIENSENNAVIILQSDHGFRDFEGGPSFPHTFFKNYSAFYFPDKCYSAFYDTLSNINTFPILFNKYFNAKIPMQKDTAVFLPY